MPSSEATIEVAVKARRRNWWDVPRLAAHVNERIERVGPDGGAEAPAGVAAALKRFLGGERLDQGISIACGAGAKERRLMKAGLVENFALFEMSGARLEAARAAAEREGLGARVTTTLGDAFATEHPVYDLVYWDHALHHMMDADAAVAWSVAALRPGGVLVINDYVGPTRLQWSWQETRLARRALAEVEAAAGERARRLRPRTLFDRWRQKRRDPSEAPQSDRILAACRRHCDGWAPQTIGCALINICGPHVAPLRGAEETAGILIRHDLAAEAEGISHFAFGIWRKSG